MTDESEIETIDMTNTFFKELKTMVLNKEMWKINMNGLPSTGKSTAAMAMADIILKDCFKRRFSIYDLDRDQQEHSKRIRDPEITNTVRVIDEWNALEDTGENSTVEAASASYFSDVMAQRNIYTVACSPKESPDSNASIFLEVVHAEKTTGITHCKLFYKIFSGGIENLQILGFVNIDVNYILKQPWYQEYRRRKFEKMDLILKEGIFRPRVLEYASIILEVVTKLKSLTRMSSLINPNIVRNYIKIEYRKTKNIQSIVGEELATREVMGILDLYKSFWQVTKKLKKLDEELRNNKMDKEQYEIENQQALEMKKEVQNAIQIQTEELERYRDIHGKYNTILAE
jgi:hypothetical protein